MGTALQRRPGGLGREPDIYTPPPFHYQAITRGSPGEPDRPCREGTGTKRGTVMWEQLEKGEDIREGTCKPLLPSRESVTSNSHWAPHASVTLSVRQGRGWFLLLKKTRRLGGDALPMSSRSQAEQKALWAFQLPPGSRHQRPHAAVTLLSLIPPNKLFPGQLMSTWISTSHA